MVLGLAKISIALPIQSEILTAGGDINSVKRRTKISLTTCHGSA
jgi:hypothetical protein